MNFLSHVRSAHPDDLAALSSDTHSAFRTSQHTSQCRSSFCFHKILNISGWLSLTVKALLLLNLTQKDEFWKFSKCNAIYVETIAKYMEILIGKVRGKVCAMLPDKLAISFEGWFLDSTHYVAIYAMFSSQVNERRYERVLLAFSRM